MTRPRAERVVFLSGVASILLGLIELVAGTIRPPGARAAWTCSLWRRGDRGGANVIIGPGVVLMLTLAAVSVVVALANWLQRFLGLGR